MTDFTKHNQVSKEESMKWKVEQCDISGYLLFLGI